MINRIVLTTLASIVSLSAYIPSAQANQTTFRVATYNIAFDKVHSADGGAPVSGTGALAKALLADDYAPAVKIANVIQRVDPDVILLNEIDGNDQGQTVQAFVDTYLPDMGYDIFAPDCNTGVDSGQDYDNNDQLGEPGDAYGYGAYPGQYCMALLSRFPITDHQTFQNFLWKDMPGAHQPMLPEGKAWYSESAWETFRLSSKTHADVTVEVAGQPVHFLLSHPTPPVFDGEEDRNGRRNFDEIRLFADYIAGNSDYLYNDAGDTSVTLGATDRFVILGDLNASAVEGDAFTTDDGVKAIEQLLLAARVASGFTQQDSAYLPLSAGGAENAKLDREGNSIADVAQISPYGTSHTAVWKMRVDYVLPSIDFSVIDSGVFWPSSTAEGSEWVSASDHRLVWADLRVE